MVRTEGSQAMCNLPIIFQKMLSPTECSSCYRRKAWVSNFVAASAIQTESRGQSADVIRVDSRRDRSLLDSVAASWAFRLGQRVLTPGCPADLPRGSMGMWEEEGCPAGAKMYALDDWSRVATTSRPELEDWSQLDQCRRVCPDSVRGILRFRVPKVY